MKKLALIVCALMLFSMVACTNNKGNVGDNNAVPNTDNGKVTDNGTNGTTGTDGNTGIDDKTGTDNKTGIGTNGKNQTLTGKAEGYGGEVSVTVEVNGDDIVSVKAVGDKETDGVGSKAIEQLPAKIEAADSTDVEAVSGATVTSNAIKEAVDKALESKK